MEVQKKLMDNLSTSAGSDKKSVLHGHEDLAVDFWIKQMQKLRF